MVLDEKAASFLKSIKEAIIGRLPPTNDKKKVNDGDDVASQGSSGMRIKQVTQDWLRLKIEKVESVLDALFHSDFHTIGKLSYVYNGLSL